MSFVNGSGISVSVESSPRTASLQTPPVSSSSSGVGMGLGAPMKKRYEESAVEVIDVSSDEEESVSPRVLFPVGGPSRDVARRLDFYSSGEWSPIPFATASSVASSSVASWEAAMPIVITRKPEEEEEEKTVGDCNVCYDSLPARSNHVFTLCGHLFCVKCLLRWWDTAITCPICRANILEVDDAAAGAAAGAAGGTVSPATMAIVRGWEIEASDSDNDSDNDNDFVGDDFVGGGGDDFVGGGGVNHLPARPITSLNRYLHIDSSVEWSAAVEGVTDPEHDDDVVQLSHDDERDNIRWSRAIVTTLWARVRFRETLFSDIDFLGGVFHEFILKEDWIELGHNDMGPHRMYEFVMCRTTSYNRPVETNFFGYISSIVIVRVETAAAAVADALVSRHHDDDEWENSHEYAFIVHVFSPVAPYGRYNIDESTFETAELLFRFSDIRRMYSIIAMERCEA